MHLVIDGYVGEATDCLEDPEHVHRFLDRFPDDIGMTKIVPPSVVTYRGPTPEDWGVSGFVIIAESHISVHTFPTRRFINVDVFSCKEFEPRQALRQVQETFQLREVNSWTLERGLEHYSPEQARRALDAERSRLAPGAQR